MVDLGDVERGHLIVVHSDVGGLFRLAQFYWPSRNGTTIVLIDVRPTRADAPGQHTRTLHPGPYAGLSTLQDRPGRRSRGQPLSSIFEAPGDLRAEAGQTFATFSTRTRPL